LRLSNITPGERYDGRCFAGAFRRRAQCFGVRIRVLLVLFAWHQSDLNKRVLVMVVLPMALVTVPIAFMIVVPIIIIPIVVPSILVSPNW
jgi:hypothetical protein